MFGIGWSEILVIVIVGVLVFGGRFPKVARDIGVFLRRTQRLFQDLKYDMDSAIDKTPPQEISQREEKLK